MNEGISWSFVFGRCRLHKSMLNIEMLFKGPDQTKGRRPVDMNNAHRVRGKRESFFRIKSEIFEMISISIQKFMFWKTFYRRLCQQINWLSFYLCVADCSFSSHLCPVVVHLTFRQRCLLTHLTHRNGYLNAVKILIFCPGDALRLGTRCLVGRRAHKIWTPTEFQTAPFVDVPNQWPVAFGRDSSSSSEREMAKWKRFPAGMLWPFLSNCFPLQAFLNFF